MADEMEMTGAARARLQRAVLDTEAQLVEATRIVKVKFKNSSGGDTDSLTVAVLQALATNYLAEVTRSVAP